MLHIIDLLSLLPQDQTQAFLSTLELVLVLALVLAAWANGRGREEEGEAELGSEALLLE